MTVQGLKPALFIILSGLRFHGAGRPKFWRVFPRILLRFLDQTDAATIDYFSVSSRERLCRAMREVRSHRVQRVCNRDDPCSKGDFFALQSPRIATTIEVLMIARDHNRAAVILWSLSNETPVKPERVTFLKQLASDARGLDDTRLITSALNHVDETGADVRTISDPVGDALDVLGLNEYLGWYWGRPEDADRMQWKSSWNKPLIVSEFGGGAPAGRHGQADERWTEEYQDNLFQHQLEMIEKIPGLAGITPWVLMDFSSPTRLLPGVQDYHNRKGVISNRGEKKLAFYTLQKFYRKMTDSRAPGSQTVNH